MDAEHLTEFIVERHSNKVVVISKDELENRIEGAMLKDNHVPDIDLVMIIISIMENMTCPEQSNAFWSNHNCVVDKELKKARQLSGSKSFEFTVKTRLEYDYGR